MSGGHLARAANARVRFFFYFFLRRFLLFSPTLEYRRLAHRCRSGRSTLQSRTARQKAVADDRHTRRFRQVLSLIPPPVPTSSPSPALHPSEAVEIVRL